jgi:aryl-alcohol dehydrogenase-like predicted oxidoreductase
VQYRAVGDSGLVVSEVGLGCNNLGRAHTPTESQEGSDAVIRAAVEAGVTLFDLADSYGREPGLSEQRFASARKKIGNPDVVVVSKFGLKTHETHDARGSRRYLTEALERSLRRLETEHIDLYLYHSPDGVTPPEETLSAMNDAVRAGKVRYIGTSNHAGWQLADADHIASGNGFTRPIATESHYNLLDRRAELEVVPAAKRFGLGLLPYFPLANGLLTGKYRNGKAPDGSRIAHSKQQLLESTDWDQIERFVAFAEARDLTPLQVAFLGLQAAHRFLRLSRAQQRRSRCKIMRALLRGRRAKLMNKNLTRSSRHREKIALF